MRVPFFRSPFDSLTTICVPTETYKLTDLGTKKTPTVFCFPATERQEKSYAFERSAV